MSWTFVLTDRSGSPLGELRNAQSRSLRFPLNRTPTLTFNVQANHPFAATFTTDDKVLVKAYDDSTGTKVLRFYGPIVGHQKTRNAQGGQLALTAAGIQWRLDKRLIGQNNAGATFGTTSVSLLDRGEIMGRIIDALNTGESTNIFSDHGDTNIRRGTITTSSSTYVGPWRYKPAAEAFGDLSGTLDGPDWEIAPTEPTADATGIKMGQLNVAAAIGSVRLDIGFAFGTSPFNVVDWTDVGDSASMVNSAISLPPSYPDNATQLPIVWFDTAAIADRGLYEAVIAADVQTDDLRLKLVQQHVFIRKVPRRVIAFTPIAEDSAAAASDRRVPRLFADYIVGDTVHFRAVERFPVWDTAGTVIGVTDVPTVDLLLRVYAAEIALDDNGVAQTSLTLLSDI